jgi:hypothetical protein
LDNQYVLLKLQENKLVFESYVTEQLNELVAKDKILDVYNKCVSIHQSKKQKNGNFLENHILVSMLEKHKVFYKKQVTINSSGNIVGFDEKRKKCYHIVDFVLGEHIEVGTSITAYNVISCKTTCRERWTQDDWSFTFPPKLYILLTLSDDYPSTERFRESNIRKIVTCLPKKNKDDRIFKLNFDHLMGEIL